jgi:hypothetical protein
MGIARSLSEHETIASVGRAIERRLTQAFHDHQPVPARVTKAALVRVEDFDRGRTDVLVGDLGLSVVLWRVAFSPALRRAAPPRDGDDRDDAALPPLDLHYLLTPWADTAEHQHRILDRAIRALERTPFLSGDELQPRGAWAAPHRDASHDTITESVEIHPEAMSERALLRVAGALPGGYRFSVPYVARVVRRATGGGRGE